MKTPAFGKFHVVGALAAFLVCGAAYGGVALPEGYTALDYIQATSAGKQWILTDVTPTATDSVKMVVKFTTTSSNQALFCSRGYSSKAEERAASFTSFLLYGAVRMDRYATQFTTSFKPGTAEKYEFVFDYEDYSATMGGSTASNTTIDDYTPGSKLALFASHTGGTWLSKTSTMGNYGTYKLYSFVLKGADGTVKLDLVPAQDASEVVGLYDTVAGTFYTSMSDTPFITGEGDESDWMDEGTDKRVLSVQKNATYALTASDAEALVSSGRQFVVRGAGTVQNYGVLTGLEEAIVVEGGAAFEVTSSSAVTGAVDVAAGTLRIPETQSEIVGNAGLMGYVEYPASMKWWFDKPSAAEIASDYTNFYPHGTDLLTASSKGTGDRHFRLHGYIWNRSDADATWSFWANFNNTAFVWMDDEVIFSNVASYSSADKRCKTVTVAPGAHELTMIFAAQDANSGPQELSSGVRAALGFDPQGRGCTDTSAVATYYQPLIDPGDGSLLTIDDSTTVQDRYWVPAFADVVLGANGVLDCGGHALTVGTLTGLGSVTDATTLTVGEKFILPVAEADAAPLTVDGALAFAAGVIVDFDSYLEQPSSSVKQAIKAGLVVARATAITGRPTLAPEIRSAGYRLYVADNTLVLATAKGSSLLLR